MASSATPGSATASPITTTTCYNNHDLDHAIRAERIALTNVPPTVLAIRGSTHSRRIDTLVSDVVSHSHTASLPGFVAISPEVKAAADAPREFLFIRVYTPLNEGANT